MEETREEAKHTPGPWEANGNTIEYGLPDGNRVTVASVNSCWHKMGDGDANARLIAAAPDLLKACRALYHAMLSYKFGNTSQDLADEVTAVAQAAIAKAEGKE